MRKLINSRLLISRLPGSALRTHVEPLGKPRDVNKRLVNLISKDTHLVGTNHWLNVQDKVAIESEA